MARLLSLLGFFLGSYAALAQQPGPLALHGQLTLAPSGDSLRLSYPNGSSFHTAAVALSPTGKFVFQLPALRQPTYAHLSYAGQSATLYLTPGDQLALTLDFAHFQQTMRYTGRGAAANNYLARALYTFEEGSPGSTPRPQNQLTSTTTPQQARQYANTFRQAQHAFLTTYAASHPLPAAFQRDASEHIDLQWALYLLAYPTDYQQLAHHAPVLPATYYDFLPQLPPHALDLPGRGGRHRSTADNTLVMRCLLFYTQRLLPSGQLSADPAEGVQLYATATTELPPAARDWALFTLLAGQVKTNLPGVVAAYPPFRAHSADSALTRRLGQMISQQQQVVPGQAPTFTLADHSGKTVSLTDFKGKVIYLDFWGTWCAPCLAEMPASNALRQHFAGRDVVFVYVAVGSPEARWQQVIADAHLTGPSSVHVRSSDQVVPDAFGVTRYPTYLLIGRDGRVRQSAAPRPSAGAETVAVLERALKE